MDLSEFEIELKRLIYEVNDSQKKELVDISIEAQKVRGGPPFYIIGLTFE